MLVYVASDASELPFRAELEASGVPVVIFTRDQPQDLPANWLWARGVRLDAEGLLRVVPDIAARHAYISGPAGADRRPRSRARAGAVAHDRRVQRLLSRAVAPEPVVGPRRQPHLERRVAGRRCAR